MRIETLVGFFDEAGRPVGTAAVPMEMRAALSGRRRIWNLAPLELVTAHPGEIHAWSITSLLCNLTYPLEEPIVVERDDVLRFEPGRLLGEVIRR